MPLKTYGNTTVDVDAEGYLTDFSQWTRTVAEAIAAEEGFAALGPAHWKVIEFMQKEYKENGQVPSIRRLNKSGSPPPRSFTSCFRAARPRRRPGSPA